MAQTKKFSQSDFKSDTEVITKSITSKIFNKIDTLDRLIYGKRGKFFILGSLLVIIIAPVLDELLGIESDRITFFSTLLFFLLVSILTLAFISTWRDDKGNWSFNRAKSRLTVYYETFIELVNTSKLNSKEENLYKLSKYLIVGGIGLKSFQNLSVFIRKPLEGFFMLHLDSMKDFERFTNHNYWILIVLGLALLGYLYSNNNLILDKVKAELNFLFGVSNSNYEENTIKINLNNQLVINPKNPLHFEEIASTNNSKLFIDFLTALSKWNPHYASKEYEYQDKLYKHLRKQMPSAIINLEYPIGRNFVGSKGRADIVINHAILIEMKRDTSAGSIQRAKGQISQYSDFWKERGPVILLLCDYDFDKAHNAFSPLMNDLAQLKRSAITIVT
jgi:hypothetical protein